MPGNSGHDDAFVWGVWVSLKEENFCLWQDYFEVKKRSHLGPFFGWLCTQLPEYPDTMGLKTMVHLRDDGLRPRIVLESTDHPLAVELQTGISLDQALERIHQVPSRFTMAGRVT